MKRPKKAIALIASTVLLVSFIAVLLVPPIRDQFFVTNLWPWPLSDDITASQIKRMRELAQPGDVIVESNAHFWQWVALSIATTHSAWVHTALVENKDTLLTVTKQVKEVPIDIYLQWHSTKLALVRPRYKSPLEIAHSLAYGESKIGTVYDPFFKDPNASCTGIVGESLQRAGIDVPKTDFFGTKIYAASSFLELQGAKIIWRSDERQTNAHPKLDKSGGFLSDNF